MPRKSLVKRVLMIAAHPDDEVLGAGATIAKHATAGDEVHVIIAAEGIAARYNNLDESKNEEAHTAISELKKCAIKVSQILGTREPIFLMLPDNKLDTVPLLDIVQKIEAIIKEVRPTTIYTHHGGDLNIDHQIVHRAALTAARPLPSSTVQSIYTFETLSSTEWFSPQQQFPFVPTKFVDVQDHFDKKMKALSVYKNEMRAFPHPRSNEAVETLAKARGASVGLHMVEAFQVIREID